MTFKSITTNDGYISLDDLISMSGNGNGVIIHREVPTYRQGRVVSRVIERTFFVDGKRVNDPEEWLSLLSVEEQTEALFNIDQWNGSDVLRSTLVSFG